MHIPAGELHAYLEGVGIELMANSDNVLRGGLTTKHMDVDELLRILTFMHSEVSILHPKMERGGEMTYPSDAEEFVLSVIPVQKDAAFESARRRSVEMLICIEGDVDLTDLGGGDVLSLSQGTAILVPAGVEQYRLEGQATLYKASVPI
jgi:mannose-6-phosphate isomerase